MPDSRDMAALPTSWALTIWDALPIFISIELAIAILIALASISTRQRFWSMSRSYPFGAVVYVLLFDSSFAPVAIAASTASIAFNSLDVRNSWTLDPAPGGPMGALRIRGGSVVWDVAVASGIAAAIKILMLPVVDPDSFIWLAIGIAGGMLAPVQSGAAVIPAITTLSASNSLVAPSSWLIIATLRPFVWRRIKLGLVRYRSPGDTGA